MDDLKNSTPAQPVTSATEAAPPILPPDPPAPTPEPRCAWAYHCPNCQHLLLFCTCDKPTPTQAEPKQAAPPTAPPEAKIADDPPPGFPANIGEWHAFTEALGVYGSLVEEFKNIPINAREFPAVAQAEEAGWQAVIALANMFAAVRVIEATTGRKWPRL